MTRKIYYYFLRSLKSSINIETELVTRTEKEAEGSESYMIDGKLKTVTTPRQ